MSNKVQDGKLKLCCVLLTCRQNTFLQRIVNLSFDVLFVKEPSLFSSPEHGARLKHVPTSEIAGLD